MMLGLTSLALFWSTIPGGSSQATHVTLPVTYYLPSLETADSANPNNAVYYYAQACKAGIAGRTQAVLHIFEAENVGWNTKNLPYVVAQVSICEDDFGADCVIATNYQYTNGGSDIVARPNISWTLANYSAPIYYIRAMGGYKSSVFSMELSFTDGIKTFAYPYSTDVPFMSTSFPSTKEPVALQQYWKTNVAASVKNGETAAFGLAYCDQGDTITSVDVVVTNVAQTGEHVDYSLMQQWACPQTVKLEKCTYSEAMFAGWYNPKVSSFNLLHCQESPRSTKDGIWVIVAGNGANEDGMNTFVLNASTE